MGVFEMLTAKSVAGYFLQKDVKRVIFTTDDLVERNGSRFYAGNARLNKYLHLAQNIYIAKTGTPLIAADFYAYNNGAVVAEIQENYASIVKQRDSLNPDIPAAERDFLDRFWEAFRNATLDELIELSHEDAEWAEKNKNTGRQNQRMEQIKRANEYREQYRAMVTILDRLTV
jgi:uncharacterized phage-associated protein